MKPTYTVIRKAIHHGEWYLKKGDAVPAEVPDSLVADWLKARYIGETKPAGGEPAKMA